MIEIKYTQNSQAGQMDGLIRIIGKIIYFKINQQNNPYLSQIVKQLEDKGAKVTLNSKRDWFMVDMFKNIPEDTPVKLAGREFNPEALSEDETERILGEFYFAQYTKSGFNCQIVKK